MESTVQSVPNGHAVGSREESEDGTCKVPNGKASEVNRLDAKEDGEFPDVATTTSDVESQEKQEVEGNVDWNQEYKEPLETFNEIESPSVKDFWKLDRRASGHLFWRRDSSTLQDGVDPSSRVKFRYDVTVREYAEQQQESDSEGGSEEEQVEDSGGFVLRKRKSMAATKESVKDVKSSTGVATSPIIIYSAVFLAILMAAAIHWYLWGRAAWANLTGGRRGGSM